MLWGGVASGGLVGVGGDWVAIWWSTKRWVRLVNPVSPSMGGGSEGEAAGVAIRNVMGVGLQVGVGGWAAIR
jgi:hypothetical protein